MLRQRVITAVVLVLILLAALSADSPWPFAWLTLALMAAAAWEWARLNQAGRGLSVLMGLALAAMGAGVLSSPWQGQAPVMLWWLGLATWLGFGAWALHGGPTVWPALPRVLRWLLGLWMLGLAWLAVAQARAVGVNFVLSVMALVWMADIAAYFGGRTWGRRKLAPSISPGKSWEGVWTGLVGVLALAAVWVALDARFGFDGPSLYTRLWLGLGGVGLVACVLLLGALSVMGDLAESLVKRAAGAKDSSALLPGHGGVLDRVDALLPVLPAALALSSLSPS